jgi:hypothetical protein
LRIRALLSSVVAMIAQRHVMRLRMFLAFEQFLKFFGARQLQN